MTGLFIALITITSTNPSVLIVKHGNLSPNIDDDLINKMSAHFRLGEPIDVTLIGFQVKIFYGQWQGIFTFEYEFESGWHMANAALKKVADGNEVVGLNVYQTEASQREMNAFTLSSKVLHNMLFLLR